MSFGEAVVDLQCSQRCRRCLLRRLPRRQCGIWSKQKQTISVGQPGMSEGAIWISIDRLLKVVDGLLQPFLRPAIPEVAPLDIQLVHLRGNRASASQPRFLLGCQLDLNLVDNSPSHFLQRRQDVFQFAIVAVVPQMFLRSGADQLCGDPDAGA